MEPFFPSPIPYAQQLEDMRAITTQHGAPTALAGATGGPDLLIVQRAAGLLDVYPQTIHEWKRRGLFTNYKMSRRPYLKQTEVLADLQSKRHTTRPDRHGEAVTATCATPVGCAHSLPDSAVLRDGRAPAAQPLPGAAPSAGPSAGAGSDEPGCWSRGSPTPSTAV